MEIIAKIYTDDFADQWDDFVRNKSRNGGIFHERKFLSYHPVGKFDDRSLVFLDNKKEIVAVFPAAEISEDGKKKIISHPGSSAGGIIYRKRAVLREVLEIIEAMINFYKSLDVYSVEMRLAEPIFSNPSHDELTYLLWHRGFKIATREISSCVDLSTPKSWEEMASKSTLNYARNSEKNGLRVEKTDNLVAVYNLIEQNLHNRYGKKPTHSLDDLKKLIKKYPDRVHLWLIFHENKPIATTVTFVYNKRGIHTFYIAQDYGRTKVQPFPYLFRTLFDYYRKRGYAWFNFGISSRHDLIKWGILDFKENIGGRASFRENWILEDIKKYETYKKNDK